MVDIWLCRRFWRLDKFPHALNGSALVAPLAGRPVSFVIPAALTVYNSSTRKFSYPPSTVRPLGIVVT